MTPPDHCRKLEIQADDGTWLPGDFARLEEGDIIRMSEPDGRRVITAEGAWEQIVTRRPRIDTEAATSQTPTALAAGRGRRSL